MKKKKELRVTEYRITEERNMVVVVVEEGKLDMHLTSCNKKKS